MYQPPSELIQQCLEQNDQAFRRLIEIYRQPVFNFTFRMLCNEEDARDAVQETFIKVWKNMKNYKPELKFSTWLFAIASNLCCDRMRSRRFRNHTESLENASLLLGNDNPESAAINSDLAKAIRQLTDKMTPKQKLIFTLRDLEGFETEEVQLMTGMTAEKIKSNLYLARQYVREQLEKM